MFKKYYWVFGLLPFPLLIASRSAGMGPNPTIITISISILMFCIGGIYYFGNRSGLCRTAFAALLLDNILFAAFNVSSTTGISEYWGNYRNISILFGFASILPACLFGIYYYSQSKVIAIVNWIFAVAIGIILFFSGRAYDRKDFGIAFGVGMMIVWFWITFLTIVVAPGNTEKN